MGTATCDLVTVLRWEIGTLGRFLLKAENRKCFLEKPIIDAKSADSPGYQMGPHAPRSEARDTSQHLAAWQIGGNPPNPSTA